MGKRSYSPGSRIPAASTTSYSPPTKRMRELSAFEAQIVPAVTVPIPRIPIEINGIMSAGDANAAMAAAVSAIPSSPSPMHIFTNPKTADVSMIPVVPVMDLDLPTTPHHVQASAAIFAKIISFVESPADLISLCLTSKLVHIPALRRLWSGLFFPTIGYVSISLGKFLIVDNATSRYYLLSILRRRPDLAALVNHFKITEGQESIEQLPILPNLSELVVEHRGRRDQNSGYHDNRLLRFLVQHSKITRLTLIGATYDELDMDVLTLPNLSELELHFSQMPNWLSVSPTQLTHLTLTGAKGRPPPDPTLQTDDDFTQFSPDPTPNKFPDNQTLIFVAPSIGGLRYLDVSCCVDISAAGLAVMLENVPRLEWLALHFCQKIDIASAIKDRPDLRNLTHLTLNCKIRCGATITSFSAYSGEVRSKAIIAFLSPSPTIPASTPSHLSRSLPAVGPQLTSITISGQTTLWERRILLPGFVQEHHATLKRICLEENMIDAEELTRVCEMCQELEELSVKNPSDLHDPTVESSLFVLLLPECILPWLLISRCFA
ncbi:hypothetical protein FRB95_002709 [Tulasnella sp. JGI-2019a]|nr:hypothetical protein FRB95_002709 [Tulasnella sp. JGI-2019a]